MALRPPSDDDYGLHVRHPDDPFSDVDPEGEDALLVEQGRNFEWCEGCQTAHLPGEHATTPPFPQEPAFGSPEAVAQAARLLGGEPAVKPGTATWEAQAQGALLRERDELRAEVERLRGTAGQLEADLEVERSRGAELLTGLNRARTANRAFDRDQKALVAQRDELADALEVLLSYSTERHCEFCDRVAPADVRPTNPILLGPVPHREDCPTHAAVAALRAAGRLPGEAKP